MRDFILNNLDYEIYTDGACFGNPGPGGWASIIIKIDTGERIRKMGSELSTTNNRMELRAVIESLRSIPKESKLAIFTDSKYVINGIESWIIKWKKNNWMGSNRNLVKNKDLWLDLDSLTKTQIIRWNWVKGHSGNIENEEVDKLAKQEAKKLN